MALVNEAKKEIHAKIVYFGPGESGKTTNLEYIYNKLKPEYRGKFKFMNTASGRLVFFDFMRPELAGIGDYSVRFHMYTAPGSDVSSGVWKNALKGADGIVFVADASPENKARNGESLRELNGCLESLGMETAGVPLLFQYNKTDLPEAASEAELDSILNPGDRRVIPATAKSGAGVLTTLSEMVKMVLRNLQQSMQGEEEETAAAAPQEEPPVAAEPEAVPPSPAEPGETYVMDSGEELPELEPLADEPEPVMEAEAPPVEEPEQLLEEAAPFQEAAISSTPFQAPVFPFEAAAPPEEEAVVAEEPQAPQAAAVATGEELPEPRILLAGDIEKLAYGRFRLPLVIRMGNIEKKTALTLDLSFD